MDNPLEDRMRQAQIGKEITPDVESIRDRAAQRGQRSRAAFSVVMVVLLGGGGFLAFRTLQSPEQIDAADGTGLVPTTSEPVDDETPPTTMFEDPVRTTTETSIPTTVPIPADALADNYGGFIRLQGRELVHVTSDEREIRVPLEEPERGFVQRWLTDIAPIDGVYYLFIDEFVNVGGEERAKALYEKYGVEYGYEADPYGDLDGIATPEELAALEHWEVAIVAYNLQTDEVFDVERRTIHSAVSPDWIYNGHITTDGTSVLVMRELWQSACLYVESLDLAGNPISLPENPVPGPVGLESLDFATIEAAQSLQVPYPEPCTTLEQIADGGVAILGSYADQTIIRSINQELG